MQNQKQKHIHTWKYSAVKLCWLCECGAESILFCCYCNETIDASKIPKEAKKKIGLQLFWHDECLELESTKPPIIRDMDAQEREDII